MLKIWFSSSWQYPGSCIFNTLPRGYWCIRQFENLSPILCHIDVSSSSPMGASREISLCGKVPVTSVKQLGGYLCWVALFSALGYKDSHTLFMVLQIYSRFSNCVQVSAGTWDVTQRCVNSPGRVQSLASVCTLPQMWVRFPTLWTGPQWALLSISLEVSHTWIWELVCKLPFYPCSLPYTCVSLPGVCPLLLKEFYLVLNFLQKVKVNPLRHSSPWQSHSLLNFPEDTVLDWCVQKQKRGAWKRRDFLPTELPHQLFCSYLGWSQPIASEKSKSWLGLRPFWFTGCGESRTIPPATRRGGLAIDLEKLSGKGAHSLTIILAIDW